MKIIHIPQDVSNSFSSRGMVMLKVVIAKTTFTVPAEPDGRGSHWFEIDTKLADKLKAEIGQSLPMTATLLDTWSEPELPDDLHKTLLGEGLMEDWNSLTAKAKWDWIRWIRSTKNQATRQKRIGVACDKLMKGDRRPCCFNRNLCTITDVSKTGVLMDRQLPN